MASGIDCRMEPNQDETQNFGVATL